MPPTDSSRPGDAAGARSGASAAYGRPGTDEDDTLDLELSLDLSDLLPRFPVPAVVPTAAASRPTGDDLPARGDLLDDIPRWGPVSTAHGVLQLVPVVPLRDLRAVARWMNDPAVAEFWELAGPDEATERHLRAQLDGDGRSAPCLGVLDGRPMSYWEIYRADLDPLARHYAARPHDTGIHLLIGKIADRGRGLGAALLRSAADHILDHRPDCSRVVAEPDLRNTASVAAFLAAGFRFTAELDLPGKRAALMIRDRRLRQFL